MADAKLSSAAFSRVVSANGPEKTLVAQGTSGGDLFRLNDFGATADPTATDDSSKGYSVGSLKYNATRGILWIAYSVAVGAAVWRRVRRGHPGYLVGNWYLGEEVGTVGTSGSQTIVGKLGMHQFFLPEPVTISDLAFKTGATIAGVTQLAIYRGGAPGSRPSVRLGVVASISNAAANTAYSGALVDGAVALEPGYYWIASQGDAQSTYVTPQTSNNMVPTTKLGSPTLATAVSANNLIVGYETNNTFATDPKTTFPADLTSTALTDHTGGRFPAGWFKVSAVP